MNKKELLEMLEAEGFPQEIIRAFRKVKREDFAGIKEEAYENTALPIGHGATISQPSTIAFMLQLLELERGQKILDIGCGSGYVLALAYEITKGETYGVEIVKELVEESRKRFFANRMIKIFHGDGSRGLNDYAPYDRIIIDAASDSFPAKLYSQLKEGGIIVVPVKNSIYQIKKESGQMIKREFPGFVFVPLQEDTSLFA